MKNNNEQTNGKSNETDNLFSPSIIINIPVKASKARTEVILNFLGFDAPLPPLEQINQINLQISIDNGGEN